MPVDNGIVNDVNGEDLPPNQMDEDNLENSAPDSEIEVTPEKPQSSEFDWSIDAPATPAQIRTQLTKVSDLVKKHKAKPNRMGGVFATVIALILLALWAGTTIYIVQVVRGEEDLSIDEDQNTIEPTGLLIVNTTIGGLVSALIVSVLAATQPGEESSESVPMLSTVRNQKREIAFKLIAEDEIWFAMTKGWQGSVNIEYADEYWEYESLKPYIKEAIDDEMGEGYWDGTKDGVRPPPTPRYKLSDAVMNFFYRMILGGYLVVWIIVGLIALYVGVIDHTTGAPLKETLQAIGTAWLGIAVASGYAYFGIKPAEEG